MKIYIQNCIFYKITANITVIKVNQTGKVFSRKMVNLVWLIYIVLFVEVKLAFINQMRD